MLPFEEQKQENFPSGQPRLCSGITEILVVVGGICMNKRLKEVDYYHKEKGKRQNFFQKFPILDLTLKEDIFLSGIFVQNSPPPKSCFKRSKLIQSRRISRYVSRFFFGKFSTTLPHTPLY